MSDTHAAPPALMPALARVQAQLAAAEEAIAAGGEIRLEDLESAVDALCGDSTRVDAAARAAALGALQDLLARLDALQAAIAAPPAP